MSSIGEPRRFALSHKPEALAAVPTGDSGSLSLGSCEAAAGQR